MRHVFRHVDPVLASGRPHGRLPGYVRLWFALDLGLALFPPLHWWASVPDQVFGLPRSIVYLAGSSLIVTASVIAAFLHDTGRGHA